MHISRDTIATFDARYRTKLINGLSGFKSTNLVGTVNSKQLSNLAIVSSVFHLGSNPALVGMIIRPAGVSRHTLQNIIQTNRYTINQVSVDFWQQAHQTSARYADDISEFSAVGLSEQYVDGINVPFVNQSKLKYAVELREILHLKINATEMVIGEITDILVESAAIRADGFIDIEHLESVAVSGLDSYHQTTRLGRLSYAKPDLTAVAISLDGEKCN